MSVITVGSIAMMTTTSTLSTSGTGILGAVFGDSGSGTTVNSGGLLVGVEHVGTVIACFIDYILIVGKHIYLLIATVR